MTRLKVSQYCTQDILPYVLYIDMRRSLGDRLRRQDTPGRFSVVFTRETTFATFCLFSITKTPSEKRSTLKEKNLLPKGSKFFSFIVDTFHIMKTCLFKCIEIFTTKKGKFSDKNSDIFHISDQNKDCGYSLESPQ